MKNLSIWSNFPLIYWVIKGLSKQIMSHVQTTAHQISVVPYKKKVIFDHFVGLVTLVMFAGTKIPTWPATREGNTRRRMT